MEGYLIVFAHRHKTIDFYTVEHVNESDNHGYLEIREPVKGNIKKVIWTRESYPDMEAGYWVPKNEDPEALKELWLMGKKMVGHFLHTDHLPTNCQLAKFFRDHSLLLP